MLIQPPFLKPCDTIAIVATARKIRPEELQFAIQYIQNRNYQLVLASNIYAEEDQFAGSDSLRAGALQKILDDKNIKSVLIARGGYGTVRIIDRLNFSVFQKHPKWICGFSDVTVMHSHLFNMGFCSIHSTMPLLFAQSEKSLQSLFDLLEGKIVEYTFDSHPMNKFGTSEGVLVGGNLSVLYSLISTVSQIDYSDKILFIEDTDEYLYHIDRMMMLFKRAGVLKKLKGLIVGGMTDIKDNAIAFGKTEEEIIYNAVKEYPFPVCFNFPAGHIKDNLAFYHGKNIKLSVNDNFSKVSYE